MEARRNYTKRDLTPPALPARIAVHALMWLLRILPLAWRRGLANRLGPKLLERNWRRRQIVHANLRTCFPELDDSQRNELAEDFASRLVFAVLDICRLWRGPHAGIEKFIRFVGEEHLQAELEAGRGAILLVPHTVSLEIGGLALAARFPMLGLTSEPKQGIEDWLFRRLRMLYSDRVLDRTSPVRRVLRELDGGRVLYYLPDEDHGHLKRSVFVPFFGKPTATLQGAGRLLAIAKQRVLPCTTLLNPATGGYVIHIFPAVEFTRDTGENCRRIREELERLVRMQPADYLWTLRMFNNQPDGRANPDYPPPKIPLRSDECNDE